MVPRRTPGENTAKGVDFGVAVPRCGCVRVQGGAGSGLKRTARTEDEQRHGAPPLPTMAETAKRTRAGEILRWGCSKAATESSRGERGGVQRTALTESRSSLAGDDGDGEVRRGSSVEGGSEEGDGASSSSLLVPCLGVEDGDEDTAERCARSAKLDRRHGGSPSTEFRGGGGLVQREEGEEGNEIQRRKEEEEERWRQRGWSRAKARAAQPSRLAFIDDVV